MRNRNRIAGAALALGGLAAAGWLLSRPPAGTASDGEAASALPVQVQRVERISSYAVFETHAGRVVNRRASDLGFDRSGRLDEVAFEEGDRVAEGDVLARLDMRELRSLRRQAVAEVRRIEAQLALAKVTTQRRNKLHAADHLAPQELDEAVYSEEAIAAGLEAARAAVQNIDVRLELSEIRAPYPGTIEDRFVDEGTVVSPGAAILRIVEDDVLEVQMGVPPDAAAALEPGSTHELVIDGRTQPAKLHAVLPTVEADTRTVRVVFRLEGSEGPVRAGSLARLTLETEVPGEGFWLPLTALAESRRGLWSAYVVVDAEQGAQVDRRLVEVIHAGAERVFVRGALRTGERVVTTGIHRLVPGQRVRVSAADVAAAR
jgi:RND family efflux transporter MFP subunit